MPSLPNAIARDLLDDAFDAEFRRRRQMVLFDQSHTIAATSMINAALVVLVTWSSAPFGWPAALAWLAMIWSANIVQIHGWLRARSRPTPTQVSGNALRRARTHTLLGAVTWGSSAFLLFPPNDLPTQMFVAVVIAGNVAGFSSIMAAIPALTVRFALGNFIPLIISLLSVGGLIPNVSAMLSVVFIWAIIRASQRAEEALAALVRSNVDAATARRQLDDALAATSDGFALYGASGQLLLANARHKAWFGEGSIDVQSAIIEDGAVQQLSSGSWVLSSVRETPEGGRVALHVDVTVLKEREAELERARLEAEAADRAKSQFLANMSHELRTPLNAVIGFSQLMEREIYGPLGDPRYVAHIADIHSSGEHLLAIINDILDMGKLESADYELLETEVDVQAVVEWAVRMAQGRHGAARQSPRIEIDRAMLVRADEQALKQVLVNLIGNALKFTPVPRAVGVRAGLSDDGGVRIEVWDEGIGIPADRLASVGTPFVQADPVMRKRYEGSGLGVALARSLCRLHQGELIIQSVEDQGTCVEVRLPSDRLVAVGEMRAAPAPAPAPDKAEPECDDDASEELEFEDVDRAPGLMSPTQGFGSKPTSEARPTTRIDSGAADPAPRVARTLESHPPAESAAAAPGAEDEDDELIFEEVDSPQRDEAGNRRSASF